MKRGHAVMSENNDNQQNELKIKYNTVLYKLVELKKSLEESKEQLKETQEQLQKANAEKVLYKEKNEKYKSILLQIEDIKEQALTQAKKQAGEALAGPSSELSKVKKDLNKLKADVEGILNKFESIEEQLSDFQRK